MTTVEHVLLGLDDEPVAGAYVEIRLRAPLVNSPAYKSASTQIISRLVLQTDADGAWTAELTPNEEITPPNSFYEVFHLVRGESPVIELFEVPVSDGPINVGDHTVSEAAAIRPPLRPNLPNLLDVDDDLHETIEGGQTIIWDPETERFGPGDVGAGGGGGSALAYWDSGTAYSTNDQVLWNNFIWIAAEDSTNSEPAYTNAAWGGGAYAGDVFVDSSGHRPLSGDDVQTELDRADSLLRFLNPGGSVLTLRNPWDYDEGVTYYPGDAFRAYDTGESSWFLVQVMDVAGAPEDGITGVEPFASISGDEPYYVAVCAATAAAPVALRCTSDTPPTDEAEFLPAPIGSTLQVQSADGQTAHLWFKEGPDDTAWVDLLRGTWPTYVGGFDPDVGSSAYWSVGAGTDGDQPTGGSYVVNLDGPEVTINFTDDQTAIQAAVDAAVGSGQIVIDDGATGAYWSFHWTAVGLHENVSVTSFDLTGGTGTPLAISQADFIGADPATLTAGETWLRIGNGFSTVQVLFTYSGTDGWQVVSAGNFNTDGSPVWQLQDDGALQYYSYNGDNQVLAMNLSASENAVSLSHIDNDSTYQNTVRIEDDRITLELNDSVNNQIMGQLDLFNDGQLRHQTWDANTETFLERFKIDADGNVTFNGDPLMTIAGVMNLADELGVQWYLNGFPRGMRKLQAGFGTPVTLGLKNPEEVPALENAFEFNYITMVGDGLGGTESLTLFDTSTNGGLVTEPVFIRWQADDPADTLQVNLPGAITWKNWPTDQTEGLVDVDGTVLVLLPETDSWTVASRYVPTPVGGGAVGAADVLADGTDRVVFTGDDVQEQLDSGEAVMSGVLGALAGLLPPIRWISQAEDVTGANAVEITGGRALSNFYRMQPGGDDLVFDLPAQAAIETTGQEILWVMLEGTGTVLFNPDGTEVLEGWPSSWTSNTLTVDGQVVGMIPIDLPGSEHGWRVVSTHNPNDTAFIVLAVGDSVPAGTPEGTLIVRVGA